MITLLPFDSMKLKSTANGASAIRPATARETVRYGRSRPKNVTDADMNAMGSRNEKMILLILLLADMEKTARVLIGKTVNRAK